MKLFTQISSLVIVAVVLVMTSLPFYYTVNYILNKEFIADTLCENKDEPELECNGKCYLKKQISKVVVSKEDSSDKKESKFSAHFTFMFVQNLKYFTLICPINQDDFLLKKSCGDINSYTYNAHHPPEYNQYI